MNQKDLERFVQAQQDGINFVKKELKKMALSDYQDEVRHNQQMEKAYAKMEYLKAEFPKYKLDKNDFNDGGLNMLDELKAYLNGAVDPTQVTARVYKFIDNKESDYENYK